MKCPHCAIAIHEGYTTMQQQFQDDEGHIWIFNCMSCPECKKAIIRTSEHITNVGIVERRVYPMGSVRVIPKEVAGTYREDFLQASAVLEISPKASAALSRRCLQQILREKGGFLQKDLAKQIDAAISSGHLPSHLNEAIDGVRNIGNFAAHPMKSQTTGEIVDVEPGEAEWLLDTLEGLFDFYIVQPAQLKAKRAALDAKLAEVGKPPMK